jgi:hypothetical protein
MQRGFPSLCFAGWGAQRDNKIHRTCTSMKRHDDEALFVATGQLTATPMRR